MDPIVLVCKYTDCNLIYKNPISLPCGNSLCQHHLDSYTDYFICCFCTERHKIPENGFCLNIPIVEIINYMFQMDPLRNNIKNSFDCLDELIRKYEDINPDRYIYDYFEKIRIQIDLQREELIKDLEKMV